MKGYNFDWLDEVDQNEVQALGKVVSIFLRGLTQEELADLEREDETIIVEPSYNK